jgi:alpha-1,6-mannosyltransferase
VIVGEGPLRSRLERQAARLPVEFTGFIGCRDTVASILASADNDPDSIAAAVTAVISRPESSRRISARRRAEQFPWPSSAAGMLGAMGADRPPGGRFDR